MRTGSDSEKILATRRFLFASSAIVAFAMPFLSWPSLAQSPTDPDVRAVAAGAAGPVSALAGAEQNFFTCARLRFREAHS